MSKHLGNVIEPMGLMNSHGADAVRWFFAASGSPWAPRRVGPHVLDEIVRKVLLTYWNTASFLVLYANAAGAARRPRAARGRRRPPPRRRAAADRPLLDRWLLSEVHACLRDVTASLEAFDTATAGRRLAGLIDDLSNWYVRRSRRRFWDGPGVGRRRLGVRDPARGAGGGHRDDGADHAVPGRLPVGGAAARRRARVGAPGVVADVGRRR